MNQAVFPRLPLYCAYESCLQRRREADLSPDPGREGVSRIRRQGSYRRKSDGKTVPRFFCLGCLRTFSRATESAEYGQKKRQLNARIRVLLVSSVSQRRIARLLGIDLKTVARKFVFLATQAKREHEQRLVRIQDTSKIGFIQFDEMESSIHTKCLPVSIPLVVEAKSRMILGIRVCSMPAKGPLARISRIKYGPRADERAATAIELLRSLQGVIEETATVLSDKNPSYPIWVKAAFPHMKHSTVKGRRGCVVGQGELKKIGFDPLFSLNHTAAMIRANVNRMVRRTWCTSKRRDRLEAHLVLYLNEHNKQLRLSQNRPPRSDPTR